MLTSLDFFYPLHDDPFKQGEITVCNVLSDVYASGVVDIDHFLVVLSMSTQMTKEQRDEAAVGIMRGMESKLAEAGTLIGGGQTVFNPWVTTGGSVVAFFDSEREGFDMFTNRNAEPGDVLVLTKPLGTQMVINFAQYLRKSQRYNSDLTINQSEPLCPNSDRIDAINEQLPFFDETFIKNFTNKGFDFMSDLNLYAAKCMRTQMRRNRVRACTDVTGFGIKGHAENLAKIQHNSVDFVLDSVVTLDQLDKIDAIKDPRARDFGFMEGYMPESSGGLLIVMSQEGAEEFLEEFRGEYGREAWVVGRVVEGQRQVRFNSDGLGVVYC